MHQQQRPPRRMAVFYYPLCEPMQHKCAQPLSSLAYQRDRLDSRRGSRGLASLTVRARPSSSGPIKQKYANRHRAYQYIAESKRWESNDRQKVRFCYRFNLTKGTDIATTFSIVKPTLQVFSSNLSPLVSGYGGLRTFV